LALAHLLATTREAAVKYLYFDDHPVFLRRGKVCREGKIYYYIIYIFELKRSCFFGVLLTELSRASGVNNECKQ